MLVAGLVVALAAYGGVARSQQDAPLFVDLLVGGFALCNVSARRPGNVHLITAYLGLLLRIPGDPCLPLPPIQEGLAHDLRVLLQVSPLVLVVDVRRTERTRSTASKRRSKQSKRP